MKWIQQRGSEKEEKGKTHCVIRCTNDHVHWWLRQRRHLPRSRITTEACSAELTRKMNERDESGPSTGRVYTFEVGHLFPFFAITLRVDARLGMADFPRRGKTRPPGREQAIVVQRRVAGRDQSRRSLLFHPVAGVPIRNRPNHKIPKIVTRNH